MPKARPFQLPPATQADDEAGRIALIRLMTPEGQADADAHYTSELNQKALVWRSPNHPNLTSDQLAGANKPQPRKKSK